MKRKTKSAAKTTKDMAKMSNDTAKMPAGPAKKLDFAQEAKAMLESCRYMALHPADAARMDMTRADIGFKTGALWLIPSFIILLTFVGLMLLVTPTLNAPGPDGTMMEVPKIAIFVFLGISMCIGWALMALITMLIVHGLASVMGGKGQMSKLFHLLSRFLLVLAPIWLVIGIFDMYLPSIPMGATSYSLGRILLDAYFVAAIAQIVPVVYGVDKKKGIVIGVLFWIISILIGLVAGAAQASTNTLAGA